MARVAATWRHPSNVPAKVTAAPACRRQRDIGTDAVTGVNDTVVPNNTPKVN